MFYRRHLPHWIPEGTIPFLTWRLAGSIPLSDTHSGPFWLQDPRIASLVASALRFGDAERSLYDLYAWVILPNHVHAIFQPRAPLPRIMRWLKGRTGRRANHMLGRAGSPFWQDESFDHWIRTREELRELIRYVEFNPVTAGLVEQPDWPWSSAFGGQTTETDRLPHSTRPTFCGS
jgi:REP element-mobilizing transposase RayT